MRSLYDTDGETVRNCLAILEQGLAKLGITPGPAPKRVAGFVRPAVDRNRGDVTDDMVDRIIDLVKQGGMSQAEIARAVGCSQASVSRALTTRGMRQRAARRTFA